MLYRYIMAIFISIPYKEQLLSLNYSDNELLILENELSDIQQLEFLISHHLELTEFLTPQQVTSILTVHQSFPLLIASSLMIKNKGFPASDLYPFLIGTGELSVKLNLLSFLDKHVTTLVLKPSQLLKICQTEHAMHRLKFLLEKAQLLVTNYFLPDDLFELVKTELGFGHLKKYLFNINKFIGYSSEELKLVFLNAHKLDAVIRFQEFFGKQLTAKEMIELLNFRKFSKKDLEVFFANFDALMQLGYSKAEVMEIYYAAHEPLILNVLLELTPPIMNFGFSRHEIFKLACYINGSLYLRTINGLQSLWRLSEYQLLKPSDITEIILSNREHGDFRKFLEQCACLKQFLSMLKIIQLAKLEGGVAYLKLLGDKIQLLMTKGLDKSYLEQACQTTKVDQILDFFIANFKTIQTLKIAEKNLLDFIQAPLKQGNKDEGKMLKRIMPFLIKMEQFSKDHLADVLALLVQHRDQLTLDKFLTYAEQLKVLGFEFDEINLIIQVEHTSQNIHLLINHFHLLEHIGLNYQSVVSLISYREGFTKLVSLLKSMEMIALLVKPNLLKPMFSHFQLSDYAQIAAGFYISLKKEVDIKSINSFQYESLKIVHLSKEQILEHLQLALMQVKISNRHLSKRNQLPESLRRLLKFGITFDQVLWLETISNSSVIKENLLAYGHYLYDLKLNALQILEFFFKKSNGSLTDFPFEKLKALTKQPLNLKSDKLIQLLLSDDVLQTIDLIEKYFIRFKSLGYELDCFLKLILSVQHINQIMDTLYVLLPSFLKYQLSIEDIRIIAYWTPSIESFHELKNLLEQMALSGMDKDQLIQEMVFAKGQLNYQLLIQQFPLFKGVKIPFNELVKLVGQGMETEQLQHQLYYFCLGQTLGLTLNQIQQISELPNGISILENLAYLATDFKKLGFNLEQIVPIFIKHQDRLFLKSLLANLPCFFANPYDLNQLQVYRILMADNFGYCISVTTRYFPQWNSLGLLADAYLDFIINKPQLIAIADELYSLVPHFVRGSFGFDDLLACGQFINQSGEFGKLFYVQSLLGVLGFSKKEFIKCFLDSKGQLNLDELSKKLPLFNGLVISFAVALDWIATYTDELILLGNIENLKLHQFGLTQRQQKNIKGLSNATLIIENLLTLGRHFLVHQFSMEQIIFVFRKFTDLNVLLSITKEYFALFNPPYNFKPQQLFDLLLADNYQACFNLTKEHYPSLNVHGLRREQFLLLIINKPDAELMIEELVNLTPRFLENHMSMPEIWDVAWLSKNVGDLAKFFVVLKSLLKMGIAKNELLEEFRASEGDLPLAVIQKKLASFKTSHLTFRQMLVVMEEYPIKRDLSSLSLFKASEPPQARRRVSSESRLV